MTFRRHRPLVLATGAGLALAWGLYAMDPSAWPGLSGALLQTIALGVNLAVTCRFPRLKVVLVRAVQRRVVNPVSRRLLTVGINPLGLMLLETRGARSGLLRVTPVGNGECGGIRRARPRPPAIAAAATR